MGIIDVYIAFQQLSTADKTKFIDSKLKYASEGAIAKCACDYVIEIFKYVARNTYEYMPIPKCVRKNNPLK